MDTRVVVEPAEEPVSIAEVKRHARIPTDLVDEGADATLAMMARAARRSLEKRLGRAFVTQTLETSWDDFPACWDGIRLPRAPLQSVESLSYLDSTLAPAVVDPAGYRVTLGTPGVVHLVSSSWWPSGVVPTVRYVAGYGDAAAVPDEAKLAICMLAATWYDRREAVSNVQLHEVPRVVDTLVDSLRWGNYPL